MHSTKDRYLLMIEPLKSATVPVHDELTEKFRPIFNAANELASKESILRYRGFHVCVCGASSANYDILLPDGRLTNSLALHYLECHRGEVPFSELVKIENMGKNDTPSEIYKRKKLNEHGYSSQDHDNSIDEKRGIMAAAIEKRAMQWFNTLTDEQKKMAKVAIRRESY